MLRLFIYIYKANKAVVTISEEKEEYQNNLRQISAAIRNQLFFLAIPKPLELADVAQNDDKYG